MDSCQLLSDIRPIWHGPPLVMTDATVEYCECSTQEVGPEDVQCASVSIATLSKDALNPFTTIGTASAFHNLKIDFHLICKFHSDCNGFSMRSSSVLLILLSNVLLHKSLFVTSPQTLNVKPSCNRKRHGPGNKASIFYHV